MTEVLLELGLVIIFATVLAYVARLLRQPMILAYTAAGVIIGPSVLGLITSTSTIALLSELGIAFLLFIVGLELDLNRIRGSGIKAAVMGTGQVVFTAAIGYALALMLGFSHLESFYIAFALAFSSTMIVIKLLADKGELDTVHGRLILGILLVQDVIAIFVLALLPNLGSISLQPLLASAGKGIVLFAAAFAISKYAIPRLFSFSARSTELLFLSTVAWLFAFAFFADYLGYSIAIGSFIAGVALASSTYKLELTSRVKPLRDFFATIFFVSLGMQIALGSMQPKLVIAGLLLSAFVIIGNPIIVYAISVMFGYNRRISIMASLPIAQISEFSLILIVLGTKLGHVTAEIASMIFVIAAITIGATTYIIKYDNEIYRFIVKALRLKDAPSPDDAPSGSCEVVVCGYNRIGYSIVGKLEQLGKSFVVLDYNPDTIRLLKSRNIRAMYGDVGNVEFLRKARVGSAKLVISTVPGVEDNELIIKEAPRAVVFATSNSIDDALHLYDAGAAYVIIPHLLGGEHVALLLEKFPSTASLLQNKFHHMKELHHRKTLNH